ncbi:MAG: glycosyltransferase family 2 protein [Bacteroidetes bacterium]|nr:glycosyltransferase family 2 protein [Bacteroidota bacterium]
MNKNIIKLSPIVSIIIPVYNAEKYLRDCINSVLAQTFSDFELLLINDGSSDSSGKICDEYASHDVRIRVFHKENGGVSSARNFGIDNAKGKWVAFIDSDDWVEIAYLEHLLQGNDIVELRVAGYVDYRPKGKKIFQLEPELFFNQQIQSYYAKYISTYTIFAVWGKLYLLSTINKYHIRFDIRLSYGEDNVFNFMYLNNINSIGVNNYFEYNYRFVSNSLGYSASLEQCEFSFYRCENEIMRIINKYGKNANIQKHIGEKYFKLCVQKIKHLYRNEQASTKERLNEIFISFKKHEKFGINKKMLINSSITSSLILLLYYINNSAFAHSVLKLWFKGK